MGEWLPPQAPGSFPPPPVPPGTPPPPPPFESSDDDPPAPAPVQQAPPAPPALDTRPNNDAVAAIACALTGFGLLVWTNGISTLVSLILGIFGVVFAGNARRNVEEGRTAKHGDLANGARIAGWITIGVSIAATIFWIAVLALA